MVYCNVIDTSYIIYQLWGRGLGFKHAWRWCIDFSGWIPCSAMLFYAGAHCMRSFSQLSGASKGVAFDGSLSEELDVHFCVRTSATALKRPGF